VYDKAQINFFFPFSLYRARIKLARDVLLCLSKEIERYPPCYGCCTVLLLAACCAAR
jgi:hypothetical protein